MTLLRLLFVALAWLAAGPALAQGVLRVAAIVNDEVISVYDLEKRLVFVLRSARLEDTQENRRRLANQVLRALVVPFATGHAAHDGQLVRLVGQHR